MKTNEINPYSQRKIDSFNGGQETGEIQVKMTCDKCGKHIEKISRDIYGVNEVHWNSNSDSEVLALSFDPSKTSLDNIEKCIADAGHNTLNYKAKVEFYYEVPKCCKHSIEAQNE